MTFDEKVDAYERLVARHGVRKVLVLLLGIIQAYRDNELNPDHNQEQPK